MHVQVQIKTILCIMVELAYCKSLHVCTCTNAKRCISMYHSLTSLLTNRICRSKMQGNYVHHGQTIFQMIPTWENLYIRYDI